MKALLFASYNIIPFILKRFLKPYHLNAVKIKNIQQRLNVNRGDLVTKALIKCWELLQIMLFKIIYR